jgi:hypothetical protein
VRNRRILALPFSVVEKKKRKNKQEKKNGALLRVKLRNCAIQKGSHSVVRYKTLCEMMMRSQGGRNGLGNIRAFRALEHSPPWSH